MLSFCFSARSNNEKSKKRNYNVRICVWYNVYDIERANAGYSIYEYIKDIQFNVAEIICAAAAGVVVVIVRTMYFMWVWAL